MLGLCIACQGYRGMRYGDEEGVWRDKQCVVVGFIVVKRGRGRVDVHMGGKKRVGGR